MNTNVFLVHTPFQNFTAHHMVRVLPEFHGGQNLLVASMPDPRIDRSLWTRTILISPPVDPRFSLRALAEARAWARRILAPLSVCDMIRVFLSNADLPIGNAFYEWTRRQRQYRFCSLPEGVGSIFPGRFRPVKRLKLVAKRCLATLALQHYADYGQHFASLGSADRIYTLAPEFLGEYADRLTRIPAPEYRTTNTVECGWVVLGQPSAGLVPEDVSLRLSRELMEYVLANASGRLLYKPHHHETGRVSEMFLKAGFVPYEDPRPVEEVFLEHPYSTVIGVGSSALLHLKLFLRERVRCISFKAHIPAQYYRDTAERHFAIESAFRKVGVEIVQQPETVPVYERI